MTKRQPRVPATHEPHPNREQRRHPERAAGEATARERRNELPPDQQAPPERQRVLREGPQDVASARAKSGHGKKTADKWNQ